jgi:UDP-glucose 4-epimerase
MNILITGCNGFMGKHLSAYLLSKGHSLYLVSRKRPPAGSDGVNYITTDLAVSGFSKVFPDGIDRVIHLAQSSRYRDFPQGALDMTRININSTFELLEWSRVTGVKQFIFTSTANVYSPSTDLLTEKSATNPTSFYGASKLAGELCAVQYQKFFQVDILRCFTVYGPRQENMLIANLIERIQEGSPIILAEGAGIYLTPVFISDVLSIIHCFLKLHHSQEARILNVSGDRIVALSDMVITIEKLIAKKAVIKMTDEAPSFFTGSNENIKKLLGVTELTSIEEGMKLTIQNDILFH